MSLSLKAGRTLLHYRLIEPLGEGGMGVVWKAVDTTLDREVAIKILPEAFATDPDRLSRFEREAKVLASLNHPNIAAIYGLHRDDGVRFLAMELIGGTTLTEATARGLDVRRVIELAMAMADGLAAAHRQRVTHRDLKPDNVMIDLDGRPKILDFGLAKLGAQTAAPDETTALGGVTATRHGRLTGTIPYMSPEQAEGRLVDPRSDVFSFGIILYEMLTGRRPFTGDNPMAILTSILRDTPAPIAQLVPSTPAALDRIVGRCLEKKPEARYADASGVRDELRTLQGAATSNAVDGARLTEPAPAKRPQWTRRATVLSAALGLAAVAVVWSIVRVNRTSESQPMEVMPLTSDVGDEESPSFSPDGNQVAYSWNGEGQDNYDIYVKLVDAPKPLRLTRDPARDVRPVFSPDGRSVGFVRISKSRWTYMVISAIGGQERIVAELPQHVGDPMTPFGASWSSAWLPDGRSVVLDGLRLLSLETGELRDLTDRQGRRVVGWFPAVAPDGRTLAFARPSGQAASGLYLLDLSSDGQFRGDARTVLRIDGDVWGLTWTADSRALVYSSGRLSGTSGLSKTIYRIPATPGARPQQLSLGDDATSPAVARTAARLAFVRNTWDTNIWRTATPGPATRATVASLFVSSTRSDWNPQYSPDGSRIAFESNRTGESAIWVAAADGTNLEAIFSRAGKHAGTPRWAPDGQRIAFDSTAEGSNFDIYVIEPGSARPLRLTTDAADDAMPSWSPDGTWIYFASNRTGRQEVWKMRPSGGPAEQVTRNGGACVYLSADGTHIYYTKHDGDARLWTVAVGGGEEREVLPSVVNRAFAVFADGIYFVPRPDANGQSGVHYLDLSSGVVKLVTPINGRPSLGLAVSPDRQHILFTQSDQVGRDLMLVSGFR